MDKVITLGLLLGILTAFIVPIAAVIIFKIKTGTGLLAALLGAACYAAASFVYAAVPQISSANIWLNVLYIAAVNAVIESVLCLLGLWLLCNVGKKDKSPAKGGGYALGFAGMQSLMLFGLLAVTGFFAIYVFGSPTMIEAFQDEFMQQPALFIIADVELLAVMVMQLTLTVLIWLCASKRAPFYFFFVAVILHIIINIPAAYINASGAATTMSSALILLVIEIAAAAALCVFVKAVYDKAVKGEKAEA